MIWRSTKDGPLIGPESAIGHHNANKSVLVLNLPELSSRQLSDFGVGSILTRGSSVLTVADRPI
jgi:hypothetical protein